MVILALSSTLECCVAAPFLIEQNGRLVQALLEILLAVLQRLHAPLHKEVVLLQARCGCIRRRSFDLLSFHRRNSLTHREISNAPRQASGRLNQTTVLLDQERRRNATLKGA